MNNIGFKSQSGFTLLEVAIVLLIVGTLLVAGIKGLSAQLVNSAYKETHINMGVVKDALNTYLSENKRLPCPDIDFAAPNGLGDDNRTSTNDVGTLCSGDFGIVPWIELRIPRESALDGFENFISYRVSVGGTVEDSNNWTVTKDIDRYLNPLASNTGSITINVSGNSVSDFAVVLISHGKNGDGARTIKGTQNVIPDSTNNPDERANTIISTSGTTNFVNKGYTESSTVSGGTFDDLVLGLMPHELLTPLIKDESLKSADGQLAVATSAVYENISDLKAEVLSYAFGNCDVPSSLITPNDPWGQPLIYSSFGGTPMVLTAQSTATPPIVVSIPTGTAYEVSSSGPDETVGTSDDIPTNPVSVLWTTLAGQVPPGNCL